MSDYPRIMYRTKDDISAHVVCFSADEHKELEARGFGTEPTGDHAPDQAPHHACDIIATEPRLDEDDTPALLKKKRKKEGNGDNA